MEVRAFRALASQRQSLRPDSPCYDLCDISFADGRFRWVDFALLASSGAADRTLEGLHPPRSPVRWDSNWSTLMSPAIDARASVGVIGLLSAAWVGLGWMWHLGSVEPDSGRIQVAPAGARTKLSDLGHGGDVRGDRGHHRAHH